MKRFLILLLLPIVIFPLSFDEAKHILKSKNINIQSSVKDLEIAKEKLYQSRASFFPSIRFQSTYTRLSTIPKITMPTPQGNMEVSMGQPDNYQNSLSITLPLFLSGQRRIIELLGEMGVRSSELNILKVQREQENQLINLYFNLLLAKQGEKISKEALLRAKDHLKVTEMQFSEGRATDLDKLRAEKDVLDREASLIKARNGVRSLYRALNLILGFPVDSIYPVEENINATIFESNPDSLVKSAIKNREEIKLMDIALRSSRMNKKLVALSSMPSLVFAGNFTYNKPFNFENTWGKSMNATIALSFPIFQGFSNIHKLKEAEKNVEKIQLNRHLISFAIETEIKNLYGNLKESEQEITVQKKNLESSKRAMKMAEEQYRQGYISYTDYRDVEFGYEGAQFGYLSALFKFRVALELLKNATKEEER